MGGEKFDSTHPEGYLFGENSDLNFLGNRPVVVGTGWLCVTWGLSQGCWLSPRPERAERILRCSHKGWVPAAACAPSGTDGEGELG